MGSWMPASFVWMKCDLLLNVIIAIRDSKVFVGIYSVQKTLSGASTAL